LISSTQGSLISRALGIAGFAFRKPGQCIVHGIKTLQCCTQPSTTIPALESIISPGGQEDNRPCTYREYQMLHNELLPRFLFRAFFMPNKTRTASVRV
jgi:hypothetical protein